MGVFPSMLVGTDPLLSIGCREPKANRDLPAKLWANCPSPSGSFLETDCACSRKGQFLGRLRGVLTCVNRTQYAPSLDLKSSLTLRVVAIALFCFVIAEHWRLFGTYRDVRRLNEHVDNVLVRQLQIQLSRIETGRDVAA